MIQKHFFPVLVCLSTALLAGCFDVVDKVEPATATQPAIPSGTADQPDPPVAADPVSPPPAGDQDTPASGDNGVGMPPMVADQGSPPPTTDQDEPPATSNEESAPPPVADQGSPPASGSNDSNPPPVADQNNPPAAGDQDNAPPPVTDQNEPPAGSDDNAPPPVADQTNPPPDDSEQNPPPVADQPPVDQPPTDQNEPPASSDDNTPPPVADENGPPNDDNPDPPPEEAPPNNAPSIFGNPNTSTLVGESWSFRPSATDPDGDAVSFRIDNQPPWTNFNSSTGLLSGVPQDGQHGDYANIRISADDGELSSALPEFTLSVLRPDTNDAPTISGSPPTTTIAGEQYVFTPDADDADGDTLTFAISNPPPWASFNTDTGRLNGSAANDDEGIYGDIVISVSDGQVTSALPAFELTVTAADVNEAPDISGNPVTTVSAQQQYSFLPDASDPDGDDITFEVSNLPAWATFDTDNGRLSGTPGDGDAGTYEDVLISVSDGALSASLSAFSITVTQSATGSVTLTWTPPTRNTDGSPLTDLAGYRIFYGTSPGDYPNEISVDNPGITSYVIDNLTANTYYFVTRSINSQQIESEYSNEASKTIN